MTIDHLPAPPVNARAEAVDNGGWVTRIAWQVSPTSGVSGYRVYGRRSDEPFLALLGTTSGVMFDTGAPWAGQDGAPLRIFAVSALLADGRESLLTDLIQNNDRDHDGLSDSDELNLGTSPDLADTDGDGLTDNQELRLGTDPLNPNEKTLTVSKVGTGNGIVTSDPAGIDCGETCSASFDSSASVSLTATPAADSTFVGWSPTSCGSALTLTADTTCTATFNLINRPPVANAGPDQTVECTGPSGTVVTLDGSGSSDPDGDPLTFTWTGPFGTQLGAIIQPTIPLGTHDINLAVADGKGGTANDTVNVTVRDTTPPTLSVALTPNRLWPPNHKMVTVTATVRASDTCDPNPTVTLVSITSNEPDNGLGDGDTPNDIQNAAFGTDDRSFALRAERSGTGTGRIYTATYQAKDRAGNASTATAQVVVPHSQSNK